MAFTTLSLGLTLTIPTNGTKNWGTTVQQTTWTKISRHTHTGNGDGNPLVTASYSDRSVTSLKLEKDLAQAVAATLTPTGTTQAVDLNNGNVQTLDLGSATGDVTLTLSNSKIGGRYLLWIKQGAIARDIVWPVSVKWPGGQKPILSVDAGAIDKVELYFDGTNHFGDWNVAYA